jgi:hypothetical protein
MPAKSSSDPLVTLPLRVPKSLRIAIECEAESLGCTLSDVMRRRIDTVDAPPLGKPAPRHRKRAQLGSVSKADPDLLRQIAVIGSNLNQLARAANTGAIAGTPLNVLAMLTRLLVIERSLEQLIARGGGGSDAH